MSESISYQRFRNRIEQIEQHMQAVDLSVSHALSTTKTKIGAGGTILTALGAGGTKYRHLRHPVNHAPRIFNFSKSLNFEHAIITIYRYFGGYLKDTLEEMYSKDPLAIVGKIQGNSLQFHELVTLGSYQAISKKMIDTTFRRLEDERSITKLFDKILGHTKIVATQSKKDEAFKHLEMRHLFIHNDGKCDSLFEKNYGSHFGVKDGDALPTNYKTTSAAINSVVALLKEVDGLLIAGNFIPARQ